MAWLELLYSLGTQRYYNHGLAGCTLFYYLASCTKRNSTHPNSIPSTAAAVTGSYLGDLLRYSLLFIQPERSGSTGTTWYEQAKSRATKNKRASLMSPVTYRDINQFFREVCRKHTKVSGSCQNLLWLLIVFATLLWFHWCCLRLMRGADRRREAVNILKWEEKRSFHHETCRRINLPFSKWLVFSLLLTFLLVLTSFFPYSWINTSYFSSILKLTPTCCRESINKTVNALVPWLVML